MSRRFLARTLEIAGVLVLSAALYLWIPLVGLGFFGLALVFVAQSVDGGK